MDDQAAESRQRMITQATRQALVQDIRRARGGVVGGSVLALAGGGITGLAWYVRPGLVSTLLVGGIGMLLIPFGLAVLARAAGTMVTARRKIRELDERLLPSARVL